MIYVKFYKSLVLLVSFCFMLGGVLYRKKEKKYLGFP